LFGMAVLEVREAIGAPIICPAGNQRERKGAGPG